MPVQNFMWGERGLVASLFNDLADDQTLGRWRSFLAATENALGEPIVDPAGIRLVRSIVEPHLGVAGFGVPDAVVLLEQENGPDTVLICEAKTGMYTDAAEVPHNRGGDGFNSTINGQLELNYRLSVALASHQDGCLIEPDWVREAYGENLVRRVSKPAVIERVVNLVHARPVDRYCHVIITSDRENPFRNQALADLMPEIFGENTGATNLWPNQQGQFGWVSWRHILDLAQEWGEACSYPPTHELNNHYFPPEEPTRVVEPLVDRPYQGVSIAYIPKFAEDTAKTAVHFSWVGNACRVRNYLCPGPTTQPLARIPSSNTTEVINQIHWELVQPQARPTYRQVDEWANIIRRINGQHGLPGC